MPALAELQPNLPLHTSRATSRPICKICSDSMISAEASTVSESQVSYLWSCDTCGYGFVTQHAIKPFGCN